MLSLGFLFTNDGISFNFYAEDTQIYCPLKLKNSNLLTKLLERLNDVKRWMVLKFLNLNESKTEDVINSPGKQDIRNTDLGPFKHHIRPFVKNLRVIMDSDFKLDKLLNSVVNKSSFQLGLLPKPSPF